MKASEAIKQLMDKYNEYQAKWILLYGNDEGFNDWFTVQVKGA